MVIDSTGQSKEKKGPSPSTRPSPDPTSCETLGDSAIEHLVGHRDQRLRKCHLGTGSRGVEEHMPFSLNRHCVSVPE